MAVWSLWFLRSMIGVLLSQRFPGRKLSVVRLVLVVLALALVTAGAYTGWGRLVDAKSASNEPAVFAGYVDVTATPTFAFENPVSDAAKSVVLSFIVASKDKPCEPSWGTYYSMDQAGQDLDIDRRIARLVQQSGSVSVSFGGQVNDELAVTCTDVDQLRGAYASVVERYDLSTIDLDLEGEGLSDTVALERRAQAIAALQTERAAAKKPLAVWLTLPVAPFGLTAEGTAAVKAMLDADVELAGVNIMTMDFGGSKEPDASMLEASIAAAQATHGQLSTLYKAQGQELGAESLWRKIGLTPMIGQNDIVGEIFSLQDAEGLHAFAVSQGVGRMSMWSLNRDATCGPNYPDLTRVSDACSGVDQKDSLFSEALGEGLTQPLVETDSNAVPEPQATAKETLLADDPATSPYPVWSELGVYVAGDRIVWHGNVYAAKWWTQDEVPDNPVASDGLTPWKLVGPVLPGDKPAPNVTIPDGTYPVWAESTTFQQGDRVMFNGRIFEAKWWNRDDSPLAALQGSPSSAWKMFSNDQVVQLLAERAKQ